MFRRSLATAAVLATSLTLGACGSDSSGDSGGASGSGDGGKLDVVTSFYPLAYATERIGGSHVSVTDLTKPGAEPHDLELSPQDVAKVSESKLVVYEKGFQPSVDAAVAEQGVQNAFDVSTVADLSLTFDPAIGEDVGAHDEHAHEGHAHESGSPSASAGDDEHAGHDHETEAGTTDPHFWLDPDRYEKVSTAIAQRLGQTDPANQADYERNAAAFVAQLKALGGEYATALKTCTSRELVTSHAAFGYLADRYGLQQIAISGLSPEEEPDPARLAKIADFAKKHKVTTIYTETLASPAVAKTVATETGATTAVLDPIEGLSDQTKGSDYLGIMRSNLATLKKGQGCS